MVMEMVILGPHIPSPQSPNENPAGLKLSCLSLLGAGMKGVHHSSWLCFQFRLLQVRQQSRLTQGLMGFREQQLWTGPNLVYTVRADFT